MQTYTFLVVATDVHGYPVETYQDSTHDCEEQARRALIHRCNHLLNIYPRKLTLAGAEQYHKSAFDFS